MTRAGAVRAAGVTIATGCTAAGAMVVDLGRWIARVAVSFANADRARRMVAAKTARGHQATVVLRPILSEVTMS